jgi:hypothetical protein
MVTPMSSDFIGNFVWPIEAPTDAILRLGFYAPWYLCVKWFYRFLLDFGLAPVQRPVEVVGMWYFQASPQAYLLMLTLKLPVIIFTFLVGIVLYKLAKNMGAAANRALTAMLVWLANPIVVIMSVMWGTWDVVALFFTLLSLMLLLRGKMILSAVSLLTGFALKVMPILLLPVCLIHLYRTNVKAFLRFTSASAVLLVSGFLVASWFGGQGLIAGVEKQVELYFPIFAGETLGAHPVFPQLSLTVLALSLLIVLAARFWRFRESALPNLSLTYLLVFFGLALWSPQYLVYPMSFLALDCTTSRRLLAYVTIILTAIGTSIIAFGFYFSSVGHSVLFIPNYTALMQQLSFFILMLPGDPIAQPLSVVLHSIFTATCLYYAAMIFLRNTTRPSFAAFRAQPGDIGKQAVQP